MSDELRARVLANIEASRRVRAARVAVPIARRWVAEHREELVAEHFRRMDERLWAPGYGPRADFVPGDVGKTWPPPGHPLHSTIPAGATTVLVGTSSQRTLAQLALGGTDVSIDLVERTATPIGPLGFDESAPPQPNRKARRARARRG